MSFDSATRQPGANDKRPDRQQSPIRLTPEEIRVLKECNKESFFYRCVPLGVVLTSATYLGVKKGFLKGHPKYGASFKLLGAGFCAWILGKVTYRNKCEEKFINLPNSSIGEAIRKKRGYVLSEFQKDAYFRSDDDETTLFSGDSTLPDHNYDASFGALNLDTDKNVLSPGLDDRERPTTDTLGDFATDEIPPPKSATSYDDLRRQNRDLYESQFRKPASSSLTSSFPPKIYDSFPHRHASQGEEFNRNKYGD